MSLIPSEADMNGVKATVAIVVLPTPAPPSPDGSPVPSTD